ncbi:MAG TPA: DUF6084 family protein [Polyangiaceae bacterium]|nr:DUF6084 family protein [Polyangiaceae bacterium]
MPELSFRVEGASAVEYAASPTIALDVAVANGQKGETIHSAILQCQVRIEPSGRRYAAREQENLTPLFGGPDRYRDTLKSFLWTHVAFTLPTFVDEVEITLHLPCTYDMSLAAPKYLHGLLDGDVPLLLLYSGTVFYRGATAELQVAPVAWSTESAYRLPVSVHRQLIDHYYPNSAVVSLGKDVFDRLQRYRATHGLSTWDEVLERLLGRGSEGGS